MFKDPLFEAMKRQSLAREHKGLFHGFTLIEMVMVLVIIGLLAAIIVPQFGQIQQEAREAYVRKTLEGISIGLETYAKHNNGQYPAQMADLLTANPQYLDRDICGTSEGGFAFSCILAPELYVIIADPLQAPPGSWTIATGGVLTPPWLVL